MKRSSTVFLQVVIVLVGLAVLAFLLGEPHVEGRNAHATWFEIYFKDPLLAYAYLAAIPFFVALYQAFRVLAYVRHEATFSPATVSALRTIKYCAFALVAFIAASAAFIPFADGDDRPQGVMMRLFVLLPTLVVASAAAMFERVSQHAVDLKTENDLTV